MADGQPGEELLLARAFSLERGDPLDVPELRRAVRRAADFGRYRAVWLGPEGERDTVRFRLLVRRAPERQAALGVAYDADLGGRLWLGLVDQAPLGLPVEASGALLLGELRRDLLLGLRGGHGSLGARRARPALRLRLTAEDLRRFDADGEELPSTDIREATAFAGIERSGTRGIAVALGGEARVWHEPGRRDRATAGAVGRIGYYTDGGERRAQAEVLWTGRYARASLVATGTGRIGALVVRPGVRLGWGEDLPPQLTFPLGGDDGFPGLHIGELRGSREAMANLVVTHPLAAPLVLRGEVAAGRVADGGSLLEGDVLVGLRIGLGAETPLGPVRVEYGFAEDGRRGAFVRIGRWF
jgi:outer membrane translocation and assembly module TamA